MSNKQTERLAPHSSRALRLIAGHDAEAGASSKPEPAPQSENRGARTVILSALALTALAIFLALFASGEVQFGDLATAFPVDVLAILLTLDIFSRFVAQTGALDAIGFKLARATKGRAALAAILMGLLMFMSSALLNNLAAIFVLAPIFLTLLRTMRAPAAVTNMFLSLMLVLCNLGGMATPMGDFPAILLMSSGLVGFMPYLVGAFPLALSIALIAIIAYAIGLQRKQALSWEPQEEARTRIHLSLMDARNRHIAPDLVQAVLLSAVFFAMVLAWALISPDAWPFFMTAVIGASTAAILTGPKRAAEVIGQYDLKTLIVMVAILSVAALVSVLGVVGVTANALVATIPNSTLLLVALMTLVTIAAGLFSAGPATAAVLPIFITLSEGPLASFGDLTGVAFAASICAGSGMFMHSATAGPTLRGEVVKAGFVDADDRAIWGAMSYLGFGLATALSQLALSIVWVLMASNLEQAWLLNVVPLTLLAAISVMIWREYRQGRVRTAVAPSSST